MQRRLNGIGVIEIEDWHRLQLSTLLESR